MPKKPLVVLFVLWIFIFPTNDIIASSKFKIPLNDEIAIPLVDLSIINLEVTSTDLRIELRNTNAFSSISIGSAQCGDKHAAIEGVDLGEPISIQDRIIIAVKKPCHGLSLFLGNRTILLQLSDSLVGNSRKPTINLSALIDPYLDQTDVVSPQITFSGDPEVKTYIKPGDQFLFQITDNRKIKNVSINGEAAHLDEDGFVYYTLQNAPLFTKYISVNVEDINGNHKEAEFRIDRDYRGSLIHLFRNNFIFQWSIGLLLLSFISPLAYGKAKKVKQRRNKKKEIERIRKKNEQWHYTRDARELKKKWKTQRNRAKNLSNKYDSQKHLADKRWITNNELRNKVNGLKSDLSSLKSEWELQRNRVKNLSNKYDSQKHLADKRLVTTKKLRNKVNDLKNDLSSLRTENEQLIKKINRQQQKDNNSQAGDFSMPQSRSECISILGLDKNFTKYELKKARKKLTMLYHPDKVQSLGPKLKIIAELEMKRINMAYNKLLK